MGFGFWGLGFGVWGLGFGLWGVGFWGDRPEGEDFFKGGVGGEEFKGLDFRFFRSPVKVGLLKICLRG